MLLIPIPEIGHKACTSGSMVTRGARRELKSLTNNLGAHDMKVFMEALTKYYWFDVKDDGLLLFDIFLWNTY